MARALKPCGTIAAYRRHRKNDEDPCDQCREANAAVQRERRNAKKAEKAEKFAAELEVSQPLIERGVSQESSRLSDLERQRFLVMSALEGSFAVAEVRTIPQLSKELREINREIEQVKAEGQEEVDPLAEFFNADVIDLHTASG
ncbi:hypothetical protein EJ997_10215 [Flaviflexus ciconiae]|uniref:Uncharacterized protein n=1 Tax=Flaviflexus ciconiae TaxID=2496867 RepID=A0A3Q9G7W0_9ACTO|nr:hypothetical protein [Flaviflexus ciconiae]AZQ77657.1 hypothetical protein EJ997_10215 [Flaviflexus ciconiae]